MRRRDFLRALAAGTGAVLTGQATVALGSDNIRLPRPKAEFAGELIQALRNRKSCREFRPDPIQDEILATLLWAAYGINRPGSGMRTAPSAYNNQETDIYAATAQGLFKYNPQAHSLLPLLNHDVRDQTGFQDFTATAPLNLIYVADHSRMLDVPENKREIYAAAATGCIGQNVYLYCASQSLGTVLRGWVDRTDLRKTMGLGPSEHITFTQSVGYPRYT